MTVLGIALRSLRQRALSTALTVAGVALGVALVVAVTTARESSRRAFDRAARGYDVILGGIHTSPLTTVLSTIYHVEAPLDTIPIGAYLAVKADERVRYAVPYALGDVYRGFRVVGTTPELFDALFDDTGRPLRALLRPGGRVFQGGPKERFEAVVGAVAAAETGLSVGGEFQVTHGLEEGGHTHEDAWEVVGVLEPTGTPNDRAIFIQLESFFHVAGHERPAGDGEGEATDPWAVSAIVVRLKTPLLAPAFARDVRNEALMQAALPSQEVRKLFGIVSDVDAVFRGVAALVIVVAALATLVGLYNAILARRREIAILRALGARRAGIWGIVTLESVLICVAGAVVGILLGHVAIALAKPVLQDRYGVIVSAAFAPFDLAVLAGVALLGVVVAVLPAWRALRVEVARHLHPVD